MNFNLIPFEKVNVDFEENSSLKTDWENIPLYVPQDRLLDTQMALSIIKDRNQYKPSIRAGLLPDEVLNYPTIRLVDNLFIEAISLYVRDLIEALNADVKLSLEPEDDSLTFYKAMCIGAIRFARYAPMIKIIRIIVGPIFLFLGGLYGCLLQKSIIAKLKKEKWSTYRIACINNVLISEKNRIQRSIKIIEHRETIIERDLKEQVGDLLNTECEIEMNILNRVKKAISL